jgi:hypothetical protein
MFTFAGPARLHLGASTRTLGEGMVRFPAMSPSRSFLAADCRLGESAAARGETMLPTGKSQALVGGLRGPPHD